MQEPWAGECLALWEMAESKAENSYEARGVMGKRSRPLEDHCKDFAEGWTLQRCVSWFGLVHYAAILKTSRWGQGREPKDHTNNPEEK